MSYKIEKEGFEMYGVKLGQMTKQGRVIGFDENDRQYGIVVECNSNSLVRMSMGITIVLEGCEDCNCEYVNKNLINQPKISIRHEIWDTTLIVQTLHCEPFELNKDGFVLIYSDSTRLCKNYAYIGCREGNTDTYHFDTQAEAQSYLNTLLELVGMINNPVTVVDLNKSEEYKLTDNISVCVGLSVIELMESNCVYLFSASRSLPLPIIKSQLEQILSHLGVKAEVRI